ncbi:MAG: tyrosine-type recombinase/integrase [Clostridia bacterium]|nr:tyrosine-type recombinase/integrase [Clostridia bacterium]
MASQSINFYQKRDIQNRLKMAKYTDKLPDFCFDYFIGIENNTSSLTRYNYSMDIYIFFNYLAQYIFKKKENTITLDDLNKLKAKDLEQYLSYLSYYEIDGKLYKNDEKGKARKLSAVRSLFKYLFNHDLLISNVASKVATPKLHNKEIVRLEEDEVSRLINAVECPTQFTSRQQAYNKNTFERDNAIITLFLGTGIRISELVGLNLESFDFSQNAFVVTRKGGNQTMLYFSGEVASALKTWLEKRATLNLPEEEKAMFISLQNQRISIRAVENLVKKFAQIASPLKNISPHKLRSTYGTNLYKETKDIYIVADVLGHKDVNTTKRHYAAISEDMRKSVAGKVKIHKDVE